MRPPLPSDFVEQGIKFLLFLGDYFYCFFKVTIAFLDRFTDDMTADDLKGTADRGTVSGIGNRFLFLAGLFVYDLCYLANSKTTVIRGNAVIHNVYHCFVLHDAFSLASLFVLWEA
jgi:hypothetical protein